MTDEAHNAVAVVAATIVPVRRIASGIVDGLGDAPTTRGSLR